MSAENMQDEKLIGLLKTFSKKEISEFEKFAASPYFNGGRNYLPLLKEITRFYPSFSNGEMTREYIYSRLYPGKTYSKKTMKNMVSALLKLGCQFLIQQNFKNQEVNMSISLAEELAGRKLFYLSEKACNEAGKLLTKCKTDQYYFESQYLLNNVRITLNQFKGDFIKNPGIITQGTAYFVNFIISMSCIIAEMAWVYKYNFNAELDIREIKNIFPDFDNAVKYMEKHAVDLGGICEIYGNVTRMFIEEKNDEIYLKTVELFKTNFERFTKAQQHRIFFLLFNICARYRQAEPEKYTVEIFRLIKKILKHELYTMNPGEPMDISFAVSALNAAVTLKEFSWLNSFSEKYADKLIPEFRQSFRHYAISHIKFSKKDFIRALEHLNHVKLDAFGFKFDTRILRLRIYYELNYLEEARSLVDSFRHFLSENRQVSESKRKANYILIQYFNELIKIKENKDPGKINNYRNKLMRNGYFVYRDWLVEKTDEILKEY